MHSKWVLLQHTKDLPPTHMPSFAGFNYIETKPSPWGGVHMVMSCVSRDVVVLRKANYV